jgi:hypothetical protein
MLLLWRRQFDLNFPGHCLRYLPLHGERVPNFALVVLGQEMLLGEHLKKVRGDPKMVARLGYGSLDQRVHI